MIPSRGGCYCGWFWTTRTRRNIQYNFYQESSTEGLLPRVIQNVLLDIYSNHHHYFGLVSRHCNLTHDAREVEVSVKTAIPNMFNNGLLCAGNSCCCDKRNQ